MSSAAGDYDYGSATVPRGALFVAADEPLLVFPSAKAAERYLEPAAVENGVYPAAYGPGGEPHSIGCAGNRVVIEPTGEAIRPEDLRVLLLSYLESRGQTPDQGTPTSELVQQVWRLESAYWQENDPYGDRFSKPAPRSCCVALLLTPAIVVYVVVTRDWTAIPAVLFMTLLIGTIVALARRKADKLDFRRR